MKPRFYEDQAPLLAALPADYKINIYQLGRENAYFVGPLLPDLGYLKKFELLRMGLVSCCAMVSGANTII